MEVVTLVVGPLQTNCYLVAAGSQCVVVDPDSAAVRVAGCVSDRGLTASAVILTHGHVDHSLGSRDLAERLGAPLLAHPRDAFLLKQVGQDAWLIGVSSGESIMPDGELVDGQTIPVGSESLTVLHTPGHSPGSVSFRGDGFVLSGDLIFRFGFGRTDLPGGSWSELRSSVLEVVFALPPDTIVYPGHGPSTTVGDELAFWRREGLLD
jgi:hydroxyacylglutathione hydrolase